VVEEFKRMPTVSKPHLVLAAVLTLAGCGQKAPPPESTGVVEASGQPGCQAAAAKVDYGNLLVVPDDVRALVESYRTAWKVFCGNERQGRPSMASLLALAREVETRFDKIFEAYHASRKSSVPSRAEDDAVSDLVVKKYPLFVPAFEGSYFESEYFRPSFEEFKKHTARGTSEDKRFFDAGARLQLAFPRPGRWWPPWIESTWDYGGCVRFGEFHWTEALDQIVKLKQDLQTDIYRRMASDWEASLIDNLTDEGNVCTCKEKGAVVDDLRAALSYLEANPALSASLPRVRAKLQAVESGKITVASEAEKHCSGG
jgi:hypothetical protein